MSTAATQGASAQRAPTPPVPSARPLLLSKPKEVKIDEKAVQEAQARQGNPPQPGGRPPGERPRRCRDREIRLRDHLRHELHQLRHGRPYLPIKFHLPLNVL